MSTTATTTKRPSVFSRLSSRASIRSNSITSSLATESSTPRGCRDYNRYAKDGKGHDFTLTYPYAGGSTASSSSASSSSSSSSTSESQSESTATSRSDMPVGARDFKLRYAKDAKGHDLSKTYAYGSANSYSMSLLGDVYVVSSVPRGARHLANKNMRYAWHQGRQAS